MNVNKADTEYIGIDKNRNFTIDVTSFILKITVTARENETKLPDFNSKKKATESEVSFFEEAKLQNEIWTKSIAGGRPEICPSIANLSLFDNLQSITLLELLKSKPEGSRLPRRPTLNHIFDYLLDLIRHHADYGIGVIVMPKVVDSVTFGDFYFDIPDGEKLGAAFSNLSGPIPTTSILKRMIMSEDLRDQANIELKANILRLFIDIGVIHFDLHDNNALVYITPSEEIKCLIIDFGRASFIGSRVGDEHLTYDEKRDLLRDKDIFFDELFEIEHEDDHLKTEYILKVLDFIFKLDNEINQQLYFYSKSDSFQMDWIQRYPPTSQIPLHIYNTLLEITKVRNSKLQRATLQKYQANNYLINFSRGLNYFKFTFPPATAAAIRTPGPGFACSESSKQGSMCTTFGGRKYRKYRKSRIFKQTYKSKKNKRTKTTKSHK